MFGQEPGTKYQVLLKRYLTTGIKYSWIVKNLNLKYNFPKEEFGLKYHFLKYLNFKKVYCHEDLKYLIKHNWLICHKVGTLMTKKYNNSGHSIVFIIY